MVRCPLCLENFAWSVAGELFEDAGGSFAPLNLAAVTDEAKRRDILRTAFLRCPNQAESATPHYLPVAYASYHAPLVFGLVGATRSGKSHLLTAMIAAIEAGELLPYGLTSSPVDFVVHRRFLDQRVTPFRRHGIQLDPTDEKVNTYADALLITSELGTWPVAFFDVAGGNLAQVGRTGRFLAGASGLIFVVNPSLALGMGTESDPAPLGGPVDSDDTFATVLGRLSGSERVLDLPATIALNKSDRLRFMPPVDSWLRCTSDGRLDADLMREESRAAYTFLHRHGAAPAWLSPFHKCRPCTLHFVSATGAEAVGGSFPRGVRPRRVLEPLLALLAMTGVLPGATAAEVGKR
jgi:hypothetical protein